MGYLILLQLAGILWSEAVLGGPDLLFILTPLDSTTKRPAHKTYFRKSAFAPCQIILLFMYVPEGGAHILPERIRISLEDISFVILQRSGDCCLEPGPRGPSSGAAFLAHLAGGVTVCLAMLDRRWEARGAGSRAQQSSSVGGKGEHGL